MWGPAIGLPPRLTLSVLAGPGRSCILGSGAATRKDWQARDRRGFSDFYLQPLSDLDFEDSPSGSSRGRSEPTRHIASKKLAKNLARDLLGHQKTSRQLIIECNPGELRRRFAHSFYIPNTLKLDLYAVCAGVFRSDDNLSEGQFLTYTMRVSVMEMKLSGLTPSAFAL